MAARTKFRAVRNFLRRPGEDVTTGTMLELDDREAAELVALRAVEPLEARDRKRVIQHDGVTWAKVAEAPPLETPRAVGAFARRQ